MHKDYREAIIDKMYSKDPYSQKLGMELDEVDLGKAVVSMRVSSEFCNGFDVAHGGIAFALGDSAAAFAANTHPGTAMTVDNHIAYHGPIRAGDLLIATATEVSRGRRLARYRVDIRSTDRLVATLSSTLYIRLAE